MARALVPQGRFGIPLYDLLGKKRRDNGVRWNADDLSGALVRHGVEITGKQIREWIKGHGYPRVDAFMAIVDVLGVECAQLWPPANPGHHSPVEGGSGGGRPVGDPAPREAQGRRQWPVVQSPKPTPPKRRRSG